MIVATKLSSALTAEGLPQAKAWENSQPIAFCHDWQGQNPDPARETEVRALWNRETLFLRFRAHYKVLYTYDNRSQRQPQLWERDVAEVFLQPPGSTGRHYVEIEISPNGDWLDLQIDGEHTLDLNSAIKSRVAVDAEQKMWTAELAVPMQSLTNNFDPSHPWRLNLFRIEGPEPQRFYSSWQPTHTPKPNFHVPDVFATLTFAND